MGDNKFSTLQSVNSVRSAREKRVGLLRSSALFSGLSRRDCAQIASAAERRTFARCEALFTEGQEIRSFIYLQSGKVKHTRVNFGGDETLLRINSPGDAVCVEALSPLRCHTCSAHATEKCRALVWEYHQMRTYLAHYPRLGVNVTRILAAQLSELEVRFCEVATEGLNRRLAMLLLRLSKQMGKQSGDGAQILLSCEEIAQMAGTTVFSVSRILSRWSEQGLILRARKAVIVCNPGRLEMINGPLSSPISGPLEMQRRASKRGRTLESN